MDLAADARIALALTRFMGCFGHWNLVFLLLVGFVRRARTCCGSFSWKSPDGLLPPTCLVSALTSYWRSPLRRCAGSGPQQPALGDSRTG